MGFLAGMSIFHLILLFAISDVPKFLNLYCPLAWLINFIFLIGVNFALSLGICIAMIYKQKSGDKIRAMERDRIAVGHNYTIFIVLCVLIFVNWVILFYLPSYIVIFHYK